MCSLFKPNGFWAIPNKKSDLHEYWTQIMSSKNSHQISLAYIENQLHDILSKNPNPDCCDEGEHANVECKIVDQEENADDDVNVCGLGDTLL